MIATLCQQKENAFEVFVWLAVTIMIWMIWSYDATLLCCILWLFCVGTAHCCCMHCSFQVPQSQFDRRLWECVQLSCFDLTHCKPEGNLSYMCGWCKWQSPTAIISNCFSQYRYSQYTSLTSHPLVTDIQIYCIKVWTYTYTRTPYTVGSKRLLWVFLSSAETSEFVIIIIIYNIIFKKIIFIRLTFSNMAILCSVKSCYPR